MFKSEDIICHETHDFWVAAVGARGFEVYQRGTTASTRVARIGHGANYGLPRAIAECARRQAALDATLQPSHDMSVWQAVRWAERKGILVSDNGDSLYAVYSMAWTGGDFAANSGKVFCLGGYDKCKDFMRQHAHLQDSGPCLTMVDLAEMQIQMDLSDAEALLER